MLRKRFDACTVDRIDEENQSRWLLEPLCDRASTLGGMSGANVIRVVRLRKTPERNWGVPWHQDRVMPLRGRARPLESTTCYRKSGVAYFEPSVSYFARLRAAFVHLDPANAENGCIELLEGTHQGKLTEAEIRVRTSVHPTVVCEAREGDVLLLHPLIVHRSRRAQFPASRRILRIDIHTNSDLIA
ncbi:MAG: phytanoyl-CoA dioxygenase family protein [Myxococcota bacterium]